MNANIEEKDILNLLNGIEMDENQFNSIDADMSEFSKKKIINNLKGQVNSSKNKRLKKLKYGAAAAAVGFCCLIGVGIKNPTFADNVPVLNSIIEIINKKLGYGGDYSKYSQMIGKTATFNGLTMTIHDAIYDDSGLMIAYTLKGADVKKRMESGNYDWPFLGNYIKINGKISTLAGGANGDFLDENTLTTIATLDTKNKKLPNKLDISINIKSILGIDGNWDFKFSVSKDKIAKHTKIFHPNKSIKYENSSITIDKVVLTPINTSIFISGHRDKPSAEDGNNDNFWDHNTWFVLDDKGNEVKFKGSHYSSTDIFKGFKYTLDLDALQRTPKYLTVIPCDFTSELSGSESMKDMAQDVVPKGLKHNSAPLKSTLPLVLPQGNFGKLTITEIQTSSTKTTVKYTVDGKFPNFQGQKLFIKDSKNKLLKPLSPYNNIVKDKNNPNTFTLDFSSLNPDEEYTICTTPLENYKLREDLKFNIELK